MLATFTVRVVQATVHSQLSMPQVGGVDAPAMLYPLQIGLHLGKNTSRYASQLKVVAPQHPMVLRAAAGEEAFDRAAAAVA